MQHLAIAGVAMQFLGAAGWGLGNHLFLGEEARTVCNGHYRRMSETDYVVFEFQLIRAFLPYVTICILFRAIGERKEVRIHNEG
jgi:hypothetical protein